LEWSRDARGPTVEGALRCALAARGRITFAEFMAVALYHPDDGYYARVGAGRDYRTAPQVSPAFGHLIGRLLARMWHALGRPTPFLAVEVGAGDGRLGGQVASYLLAREPEVAAVARYVAIDRFGRPDVVADAGALPLAPFVGCVLSNELFDALPVNRLVGPDGELWVIERDGQLGFEVGELSDPSLAADLPSRPGQVVDVAPAASHVIGEMARALERGYVLTIDYGGSSEELRAPYRMAGTLLAYYRGRAHDRLLERPGQQDLTAHVDFDRLQNHLLLRTVLFESQSTFLRRLGLDEWLGRLDPSRLTAADLFNARLGATELMAPGRLGKLRALLQAKDAPDPV
jgi:SAM-dependent MidA family methyltransferase